MLSLAGQIFIVTKIVPPHTPSTKIFCLNLRERLRNYKRSKSPIQDLTQNLNFGNFR
ncbi:MAG: hypothetical protein LBP59_08600 [Planctomycetaceae bacterium]|nr:hypothetical protein [Planctomycetaceae bacterium]